MLRMDRNVLPGLPRPVFAIQAEWVSEEILVSVLAGQGEHIHYDTFPQTEQTPLERHLLRWLRGLPYFEAGHGAWESASGEAAVRIAQWAHGVPPNTTTNGQDHE